MDDETRHETIMGIGAGAMELQDVLSDPEISDALEALNLAARHAREKMLRGGLARRASVLMVASIVLGPMVDDG